MRRICRFRPCFKMILKDCLPVASTSQGMVTVSRMATPEAIFSMNSGVMGALTVT